MHFIFFKKRLQSCISFVVKARMQVSSFGQKPSSCCDVSLEMLCHCPLEALLIRLLLFPDPALNTTSVQDSRQASCSLQKHFTQVECKSWAGKGDYATPLRLKPSTCRLVHEPNLEIVLIPDTRGELHPAKRLWRNCGQKIPKYFLLL